MTGMETTFLLRLSLSPELSASLLRFTAAPSLRRPFQFNHHQNRRLRLLHQASPPSSLLQIQIVNLSGSSLFEIQSPPPCLPRVSSILLLLSARPWFQASTDSAWFSPCPPLPFLHLCPRQRRRSSSPLLQLSSPAPSSSSTWIESSHRLRSPRCHRRKSPLRRKQHSPGNPSFAIQLQDQTRRPGSVTRFQTRVLLQQPGPEQFRPSFLLLLQSDCATSAA